MKLLALTLSEVDSTGVRRRSDSQIHCWVESRPWGPRAEAGSPGRGATTEPKVLVSRSWIPNEEPVGPASGQGGDVRTRGAQGDPKAQG